MVWHEYTARYLDLMEVNRELPELGHVGLSAVSAALTLPQVTLTGFGAGARRGVDVGRGGLCGCGGGGGGGSRGGGGVPRG